MGALMKVQSGLRGSRGQTGEVDDCIDGARNKVGAHCEQVLQVSRCVEWMGEGLQGAIEAGPQPDR